MNNRHPLPIQPIHLKIEPNWPNWQCCLAGSSKTAPRILVFSIAMDADYSFYVKFIATYASAFLRYNNSVLAREVTKQHSKKYDESMKYETSLCTIYNI